MIMVLRIFILLTLYLFSTNTFATSQTSWQRIPGPDGGYVYDVLSAPSDPLIVYALTGDTLFRSTDGGETWAQTSNMDYIYDIVIAPDQPNTLYNYQFVPLSRSQDGGHSWQTINDNVFLILTISPSQSNILYATNYDDTGLQLTKSVDNGITWFELPSPVNDLYSIKIVVAPNDHDTVYLINHDSTSPLLYVSNDGGLSWNHSSTGLPSRSNIELLELVIAKEDSQQLLAFIKDNNSNINFLYRSTDGAQHWEVIETDLPTTFNFSSLISPISQLNTLYAYGLSYMDSFNPVPALFRSDNAGLNWSLVKLPPLNSSYNNHVINISISSGSDKQLYAATERGVYTSIDGGESWSLSSKGIDNIALDQIVLHPQNPDTIYTSTKNELFTSTDTGESWQSTEDYFYDSSFIKFIPDPIDADKIYILVEGMISTSTIDYRQSIYKTADGGQNWQSLDFGIDVHDFNISSHETSVLYATTEQGLYLSEDSGDTWSQLSTLETPDLRNLQLSPHDPQILYAYQEDVLISEDSGETWTALNIPEIAESHYVSAFAVDPNNRNTLYISFANPLDYLNIQRSVYKSRNSGQSWQLLDRSNNDIGGDEFIFSKHNPGMFFMQNFRPYRNRNNRWLSLILPIHSAGFDIYINDMDIGQNNNSIYIASQYGLYTRNIESISDSQLVNISTRGLVDQDEDEMNVGFIVQRSYVSLLAKGEGPILGRSDVIDDPVIQLGPLGEEPWYSNDDWGDDLDQSLIASLSPPASPSEAALVSYHIYPGAYILNLSAKQSSLALGIGSVTDLRAFSGLNNEISRQEAGGLVNVSTRGLANSENDQTIKIGFIVQGSETMEVLVKAEGPILNMDGVLQDPLLTLSTLSGELIVEIDDWLDHPSADRVAELAPPAALSEAAGIISIEPGEYVLSVSGKNNASGLALGSITDIRAFGR